MTTDPDAETEVQISLDDLHRNFSRLITELQSVLEEKARQNIELAKKISKWVETYIHWEPITVESNIDDIFKKIRPYYDFIDCKLILDMSEAFLRDQKTFMDEIKSHYLKAKKLCRSATIKNLRKALEDKYEPFEPDIHNTGMPVIKIKLQNDWEDISIEGLKLLIKKLLPMESRQSLMKYIIIRSGSVHIIYPVLNCRGYHIIKHTEEKLQFMRLIGIFSLYINDHRVLQDENMNFTFKLALLEAVTAGNNEAVEFILQLETINIDHTNEEGETALMLACERGHKGLVYSLLSAGANVDIQDSNGWTALMIVSQHNHISIIHMLLQANANPHLKALDRSNASMIASYHGNYEIVQLLISKGVDYKYQREDGWTAFMIACQNGHTRIVELLLKEQVDPNVQEKNGWNAFMMACQNGYTQIVELLLNHHSCNLRATNKKGETILHCAVEHVDILKYLIDECSCDPMATTLDGRTPLHYAANFGCSASVEFLLSTGNSDPLAKDKYGKTPFQLAKERQQNNGTNTLPIFNKFSNIKSSHPIDSYVKVLLLGNPGVGKSTLSHVINDTATGSFVLGSFRNVGGVVPCTAGIIPYKLQHRTLGNIILYDFAGHSKYYSSHSAVIENLLQGSGGVFLIVVNILEKEAVKQLHQWLTVVRNEAQKALNQCHVIVIVSHVDEINNPAKRRKRKEEIQEIIVRERCDSVFLDCRKLGGSGVDSFFKMLSSACESIRSTRGRNLSLYCHMMYGLLEERNENRLTLSDVMSAGKDNNNYLVPDNREDVLDILHSLHSTGLISVLKSEDQVWVVVNKGILLTEVDGILFAPKTFKEHVDIASNTGIVSVSGLTRLFPKYDPDMLICFLKNMELCQEMKPSFLRMTNLHRREKTGERLLFFPCLLSSDRPNKMTSKVYQFGWCLQCTSKHGFFPPRYFHVLTLHLAFKMAQPQEDEKLKQHCTFWKNGLYWFDGHGVGLLVEIVDESQCVLVMMSCEKGYSDKMVSLRRDVIGEVMSVYREFCPSLEVKELVIDPKELAYPVNTPRERTVYSVKDILSTINKREEFLVKSDGTKGEKVKEILPDESLSDISNLSLLGGKVTVIRNTHHHHHCVCREMEEQPSL